MKVDIENYKEKLSTKSNKIVEIMKQIKDKEKLNTKL